MTSSQKNLNYFAIEKNSLVEIVTAYTKRTAIQDLEMLKSLSSNSSSYLLQGGLRTDNKRGLQDTQQDQQTRIQFYGSNKRPVIQPPTFLSLFWDSLDDFTMKILIVASFLSIGIEVGTASPSARSVAWIEGCAIFVAVMICALVTSINNYQKERQFLKLNQVTQGRKRISVKRKGQIQEMNIDDVLVGDIVVLGEGMQIPADGMLIESNEITIDESSITGQSDPVKKNTYQKCWMTERQIRKSKSQIQVHDIPSPVILSGTRMLTGEGLMLVLVVGPVSCLGKLRALAQQKEDTQTPLQQKLEILSKDISKFGLASAVAIVIILLIRFAIVKIMAKTWDNSTDIAQILNYFILGITVVVVAIPQGLPLSVTLSLAFSVKQMLEDQNLVRRLQACETMGGANVICSDKTGTLTQNKMTVNELYNGSRIVLDFNKQTYNFNQYFKNEQFINLLKMSCCLNSNALLKPQEKGSSTEIGLLKMMEKFGVDYQTERENNQILTKIPFSSKRKRMSVIIKYNNEKTLFIKGASEMVLEGCQRWFNPISNTVQILNQTVKQSILANIENMAQKTLRTLCLAYKTIRSDDLYAKDEKDVYGIEKIGLTFLCVIGVRDTPRPEVFDALVKCRRAGVRVRMVTGDNLITAKAIAIQIGIIQNPNSLVMLGADFMRKIGGVVCKVCRTEVCNCERDPETARKDNKQVRIDVIANIDEFESIVERLDVLARSRPQDKYALVTGLKAMGNVVAVTGDGTNDAPALKKADVGFAMGISGTQVARQAAAIILLDDNFNSIVKAVMWGRNIYDSIKKFVQFQLTVNVVAVMITLIGAAILKQQILRPIQMLWINLIMDTFASLALATEAPHQGLLQRLPHSRGDYIITRKMFKHIIVQSIFQITVMIILVFAGQMLIPEYVDDYDTTPGFDPNWKYLNGVVGGNVRSGRFYTVSGGLDYKSVYDINYRYSRHFTFVFNTFVMMQLFNFINSRKLEDEFNVFQGIFRNWMFGAIVIAIFVLQILLVTFGSIAFGVYSFYGLTIIQWLISILIGAISLLVSVIAKLIREDTQIEKNRNLDVTIFPMKNDMQQSTL